MRVQKERILPLVGLITVLVLILDGKTTTAAALDAVTLCIQVLIPTLFPFLVFTPMLSSGNFSVIFRPLALLFRLRKVSESLLLSGYLGGYPVGAVTVARYYRSGILSREDSNRLLPICNNPGPSFLFGIGMHLFADVKYCWLAWGIILVSSVYLGICSPGVIRVYRAGESPKLSIQELLAQGIRTMAMICGWVVLFRIWIAILDRWILWLFPTWMRISIYGFMELANGCNELAGVGNIGYRLLFFTEFLSFGGLCVTLQTMSAAQGLDTRSYLMGKAVQSAFTLLLATAVQFLLPVQERFFPSIPWIAICAILCILYPLFLRKNENSGRNLYPIGV